MAKYIVEEVKKGEKKRNPAPPFTTSTMINILPGIVWSVPLHQKLFPNTNGWVTVGLCVLFILLYIILSYIPVIAAIPAIAGGIILTGLFWVPADYIGNDVARIIVKVLLLVVCGLVELAIFANATVPWLEGKEENKPRIRIEK